MLYEFHLGESYKTDVSAAERNALIRYSISIGTRAKCSTNALLRPFKQKYLKAALREVREDRLRIIAKYQEEMKNDPAKDFRAHIKQEREVIRNFPKHYIIYVAFPFNDKKWIEFHNSLNPRITFGYSNMLHEECDFVLTEEIKQVFLNASLKELPMFEQDRAHDWGNVYFDSFTLFYEDLQVLSGERNVLSTLSHEQEMTISLTDEELTAFIDFEGKQTENLATIEKLKALLKDENNTSSI